MTLSLRSLFLVPLLALAAPASADRLLVAGPDGIVMQADTADGVFQYFACQCSGPIQAMTADEKQLYTADDFSQLFVYDVQDGALLRSFALGIGQISALAVSAGTVFVGTEDGLVAGIDPVSGDVLDWRTIPTSVHALLAHDGFLFVGGGDGALYRAPVASGAFEYFTCFCFSTVRAIVVDAGDLVAVDDSGLAARIDDATGQILTAFLVGATNVMAVSNGRLLLYYDGGTIPMADAQTGQRLPDSFFSPIAVEAMLVIDAPEHKTRPVRGNPRKP